MLKSLGEDLKKIMLAGIGAVAVTSEKSMELIDDLVKKGQVTVEQGKELNEELKRNIKTKVQDAVNEHVNVTVVTKEDGNILDKLDTLSEEELQAVKAKLDAIEKQKNTTSEEGISEN
ncbi:MAG: phasin family protein [Clostridium sp.]|nr:phasin family protein [Clostridium sp.]MCI7444054.1 phasin family protein [Clostridium sp.]